MDIIDRTYKNDAGDVVGFRSFYGQTARDNRFSVTYTPKGWKAVYEYQTNVLSLPREKKDTRSCSEIAKEILAKGGPGPAISDMPEFQDIVVEVPPETVKVVPMLMSMLM